MASGSPFSFTTLKTTVWGRTHNPGDGVGGPNIDNGRIGVLHRGVWRLNFLLDVLARAKFFIIFLFLLVAIFSPENNSLGLDSSEEEGERLTE
jgi:hypothetical protein